MVGQDRNLFWVLLDSAQLQLQMHLSLIKQAFGDQNAGAGVLL